eukprot:1127857-Pyramimonas_sp.AAC.1
MQTASLGMLERAWRALAAKRAETFTWQHAPGPLAVVCMSLTRVDWSMEPSLVAQSDLGESCLLLHIDPHHVVRLLHANIQKWHMRGIQTHFPEFPVILSCGPAGSELRLGPSGPRSRPRSRL